MFPRRFTRFAPEGAAPGAPAPAPAPAAAPAAPDIAAIAAEAVKPFLARIEALEAERAQTKTALEKAEADKLATAASKATAEEQIAALRRKFGEAQASNEITLAASRYQFASDYHREQALVAFRAQAPITVDDSGAAAATFGGKKVGVGAAFEAWFNAHGSIYKAAPGQPGQPLPSAAPANPDSKSLAGLSDDERAAKLRALSDAEFAALKAKGVSGKLTNDRSAPLLTLQSERNPYLDRRARILAGANGRSPSA